MDIGLKIKKVREYRNYTQMYLADQLDISQNAYSKIENGLTKLTTERLEQIAQVLDIPIETLLDNEKQVLNLNNNHIDKFYGYIEHLHEENREITQQSISILQEQLDFLKKQNEILLNTLDSLKKK